MISLNLFILLVATCVLYIIPPFTIDIQGKRYFYDSLANPFNAKGNVLSIKTPGITDGYEYVVKSVSAPDNIRDVNIVVSKDIKTLEQRLQSYVGNNFEIRTDVTNGEVRHVVILNKSLDQSTNILTSTNSDFEIKASRNELFSENSNASSEFEKLDLSRHDFGYAELIELKNTDGTTRYDVRMPLSLFASAEKIKLIQNKLNNKLNVTVAGVENQAFFDYNTKSVPTGLVLAAIPNRSQAVLLRAFLNTPPTNLAYELESVTFVSVKWYRTWIAYGLILFTIIVSILIDGFWLKKNSKFKIFTLLGLAAIFLASLKFFDQTLSLTTALLFAIPLLFAIFSLQMFYFVVFTTSIFLIKLLTLLNGFDITLVSMVLIVILTMFIYFTNDINSSYRNGHIK